METRSRRNSEERAQANSPTIEQQLAVAIFILIAGPNGSLISIQIIG
jgi:hypothetical protein